MKKPFILLAIFVRDYMERYPTFHSHKYYCSIMQLFKWSKAPEGPKHWFKLNEEYHHSLSIKNYGYNIK